jgi:trigger factor
MMTVTETKNDGLTREFKIAVPAADIEQKMVDRLSTLGRTARIPGFRQGKVPLPLLRRRYGPAVRGEILEETVSESSRKVIADHGLRPALEPHIEVIAFEEQGDLEYRLALEVLPEVSQPDFAAIKLERRVADPSEEEIDRTLDRIAKAYRTWTSVGDTRPAANGDKVIFDFVGRSEGEDLPGGRSEGAGIELGAGHPLPGIEEGLLGVRAGEEKMIKVVLPDDARFGRFAGKEAVYEVTVKDVLEPTVPAIDDELAKRMEVDTLEALRQRIREEHARELKGLSRQHLKRALLDELAKTSDFAVPSGLVQRELDSIVERYVQPAEGESAGHGDDDHDHDHAHCDDPTHDHSHDHEHGHAAKPAVQLTAAEEAEYRALAERRVRLGLLLAEIGRINKLTVGEEDLNKAVIAEARRYPGQEQAVIDFFRKNRKAREALGMPILEDKVVDFILEMVTVSDRQVAPAELLGDPGEDEGREAGSAAGASAAAAD